MGFINTAGNSEALLTEPIVARVWMDDTAGLMVNYGISNTIVLEIPWFTNKPAIYLFTNNYHDCVTRKLSPLRPSGAYMRK